MIESLLMHMLNARGRSARQRCLERGRENIEIESLDGRETSMLIAKDTRERRTSEKLSRENIRRESDKTTKTIWSESANNETGREKERMREREENTWPMSSELEIGIEKWPRGNVGIHYRLYRRHTHISNSHITSTTGNMNHGNSNSFPGIEGMNIHLKNQGRRSSSHSHLMSLPELPSLHILLHTHRMMHAILPHLNLNPLPPIMVLCLWHKTTRALYMIVKGGKWHKANSLLHMAALEVKVDQLCINHTSLRSGSRKMK